MPILPESTDAVKNPSPQLRAVLTWVDAVTTSHDADKLAAVLTDDYTHYALPKSQGFPPYDKPSLVGFAQQVLMKMFLEYNTIVHEVIETQDKVVLHMTSTGHSSTNATFTSEVIIIAHVVPQEDGEYKIKTHSEFADTECMKNFFFEEMKRQEAAKTAASAAEKTA
ncbi:hypothetical protein EIP91_002902 [Steccherinum ochraceum]|uniref:SnoaL-like domain-containing protein n=1 Tax=Steccherinum ochraceum TaxID=92696 RepID=A0A4R0RRW1_9APHY|nr:hypothetical protein EIP91_002902 [Steccherinum ochraceum]